ncbi:hypothetical protein I8752_25895 [Nostocaceae cyanobacterium CENA369]|uniref:Uncharacterized protein n=1 Tax=Dendronalium phyllosphericum CENA369 TaxID=1725256 RepID=A0A8J7IK82_9NOST|nr:hypothetical protein [Dendronalium phyllosphericum]MBH8576362.1 hypothetical protein [Dendronalium phyllosphericum CENA369]
MKRGNRKISGSDQVHAIAITAIFTHLNHSLKMSLTSRGDSAALASHRASESSTIHLCWWL